MADRREKFEPVPQLVDYWAALSADEKREFAKRVGRSRKNIEHVAHGHRRASHVTAKRIEQESFGRVKREHVRPDIFRFD